MPGMRRLSPARALSRLCGRGALLVVAPHPDDEVLGCGGLLAEALLRKRPVCVVLATDGGASHPGGAGWPRARLARLRHREMQAALRRLGGRALELLQLGLRDGAVGGHETRAVAMLVRTIHRLRPRTVLVPQAGDQHADHRAVHALARAATRRSGVNLAEYAVWGALAPGAGMTVPTARHSARRRAALRCHASQLGLAPAGLGPGFVVPPGLMAMTRRPREEFRFERHIR
jgi:LmbE family N-acetylglucosaminyl deacetylase